MIRLNAYARLPLGTLVLAGAFLASAATAQPAKPEGVPNPPNAAAVTPKHPGYKALKAENFQAARDYLAETHAEDPNDAFAELNLGVAYQELGRMDLAEPLYRQAMTHGRGLTGVDTTQGWAAGKTVEEIACRNLEIGLPPAPAGQAKPCQTVLTVDVRGSGAGAALTEFNTYFDFDSDVLTPAGRENVARAAQALSADSAATVVLTGRASKIGSTAHNYDLSERRAKAVRDALVAAGVADSRITLNWTGETALPVPQAENDPQPANRVVEGKIRSSGSIGAPRN
jgi:outer membrane protein OmpA-like peptidoglycan-associated protein